MQKVIGRNGDSANGCYAKGNYDNEMVNRPTANMTLADDEWRVLVDVNEAPSSSVRSDSEGKRSHWYGIEVCPGTCNQIGFFKVSKINSARIDFATYLFRSSLIDTTKASQRDCIKIKKYISLD